MKKKIKIILKIILIYITCLPIRNKKKIIFGAWFGNKFADNSKYLYKSALNNKNIRPIWITKNRKVYDEMKADNYEVYMGKSFKGIYYQLTSKFYVTCTGKNDVSYYLMGGAKHIELWHGLPLKKIMYDDLINKSHNKEDNKIKSIIKKIEVFPERKKLYLVSTSSKITQIYTSAFRIGKDKIKKLGQPRNDVFFNEEIEDTNFPQIYKDKKVILYMPTHRDEGKQYLDIEKKFDLKRLNKLCKDNNVIFLIKKHYYHLNEKIDLNKYENIEDITDKVYDSQMLLKYTDILITDYSSCYIDYLLLDRPIVFYNFDYDNYVINDREMYFEYNSVTPGKKVESYSALENELYKLLNNEDEYIGLRKKVRDIFYSLDNQSTVCNKIINFFFTDNTY